jgi:tetratricopeptide (TPR) repeat protein
MARAHLVIVGAAVAGVIAPGGRLGAQPTGDKALAEQLFEQGRDLAKHQRWAEACPKFEASLRYDNALGARLNLANCYQHIGKLASAWGLYRDSADLAQRAGDTRRRDYALKQAAALEPRLARLTIARPARAPTGLTVARDGVAIEPAVLGSAMYVDPGSHEVSATAPGFEPFKTSIVLAEAKSESVVIPELVPLQRPADPPQPRPLTQAPPGLLVVAPARPEPPAMPRNRKYVALGVAATGAVVTGVGLFLGVRASSRYDQAKDVCGDLICETDADFDRGRDLIARARTDAAYSTILVAAGAAAVGTGVVLWLTAPRRARIEAARIAPILTDRDVGVALAGRF